jgi:hypothetical protein
MRGQAAADLASGTDVREFQCHREQGAPTRVHAIDILVASAQLKEKERLEMGGTLILELPGDIERHEMSLVGEKEKSIQVQGARLEIRWGLWLNGRWPCEFFGEGASESMEFQLSAYDDRGWISDLNSLVLLPGATTKHGAGEVPLQRKPSRLVLSRIIRKAEIRVPFAFKDLVLQVPPEEARK